MSIRRDEQLHLRAVELVRAAYEVVDGIRKSISPNSTRRDLRRSAIAVNTNLYESSSSVQGRCLSWLVSLD